MKLSYSHVEKKLIEYKENTSSPMFSEFVNLLGMSWSEWCAFVSENPSSDVVKLMVLYKEHLECQIEKELVYQKQGKFYNHSSAQFVLKKLNPMKYGDKVMSMSVDAKASGFKLQAPIENVSDLNLIEKMNS